MGILDKLLGREDKKDTMDHEIKADKPVKIENNRQDVLDAMMGKNGKITVLDIAIDTITMREIPKRNKLYGIITTRGIVTSTQITVLDIAIDTITMREIPKRNKLYGIITTRGIVTSTQCFNRGNSNAYSNRDIIVPMKSIEHSQFLELIIGDKIFELPNDHFLPEVNIGDDVEIMHVPDSNKSKTPNSSGRDVRVILVLKNHTNGALWCFSLRRQALGF